MNKLKQVSVFCGSRTGKDPIFVDKTVELGKCLAENKVDILYGAGDVGLMDVLATASLNHGGRVHGAALSAYPHREGLTSVRHTDCLNQRKMMMSESDGFIILPGSIGTLDESMHIMAMAQTGALKKPIAFYNVNGYFNRLLEFLQESATAEFMRPEDTGLYFYDTDPKRIISRMAQTLDKNG